MSSSLAIEATDSSGRWYLLPGSGNSYDLKVTNESDHAVLCKLGLDEPAGAGRVTPASVTLKAGESRSVTVAFNPDWLSLRDRKAVVTARNAAGTVLATFVHDLVATTSTDCSVSLSWKDEITGEGALRGFILTCTIRSISSTPGVFEPEFVEHPSIRFPEKQRITLGPGETSSFDVPIIWNRSARDNEGWNHPRTIEVGVAVTHGRRSATAPWDLVQQHIEPYITDADKAPMLARRPPPPQFTQPGGAPPPVSPMPTATAPEPTLAATMTESHSARQARAEMESGVATGGMRLPPPPSSAPAPPPERETVSVAPATLMLVALAFAAIVIVLFWAIRVPNTSAVSTAPVVVASPAIPVPAPTAKRAPAKHGPKAKPAAAAVTTATSGVVDATASTTASAAQPAAAPRTSKAGTSTSGQRAATHRAAAVPPRVSPIDRSALVQLADVGAEYLRGGRQVHVFWDSYAQASADVQLLDDRNSILAETRVGRRMAAMLFVPRGYRGSVYIQVTAIGYNGERVESSASLGPP
jgi:hypothetical protein